MRRCELDEVFDLGGWAAGARSNRLRGLGSQWLSAQPPRGAPATKRASGYHMCVNTTRVGHSDTAGALRLYVHVLRKAASGVADGFAGAIEQAAVSKPVSKSGGVSKIC